MNILDLVIVYLACGMPFAVYRVALSASGATETAIAGIRAGFLWPLDGGRAAVKRLRSVSRTLSRPRIEIIRSEMEELLAKEMPQFGRFQFREVFDRYSGLARALNSEPASHVRAISHLAVGQRAPAAEACLRRVSNAKIDRHTESARRELIEYISACSSPDVFELAAFLSAEVSDHRLNAELCRYTVKSQQISATTARPLSRSAS